MFNGFKEPPNCYGNQPLFENCSQPSFLSCEGSKQTSAPPWDYSSTAYNNVPFYSGDQHLNHRFPSALLHNPPVLPQFDRKDSSIGINNNNNILVHYSNPNNNQTVVRPTALINCHSRGNVCCNHPSRFPSPWSSSSESVRYLGNATLTKDVVSLPQTFLHEDARFRSSDNFATSLNKLSKFSRDAVANQTGSLLTKSCGMVENCTTQHQRPLMLGNDGGGGKYVSSSKTTKKDPCSSCQDNCRSSCRLYDHQGVSEFSCLESVPHDLPHSIPNNRENVVRYAGHSSINNSSMTQSCSQWTPNSHSQPEMWMSGNHTSLWMPPENVRMPSNVPSSSFWMERNGNISGSAATSLPSYPEVSQYRSDVRNPHDVSDKRKLQEQTRYCEIQGKVMNEVSKCSDSLRRKNEEVLLDRHADMITYQESQRKNQDSYVRCQGDSRYGLRSEPSLMKQQEIVSRCYKMPGSSDVQEITKHKSSTSSHSSTLPTYSIVPEPFASGELGKRCVDTSGTSHNLKAVSTSYVPYMCNKSGENYATGIAQPPSRFSPHVTYTQSKISRSSNDSILSQPCNDSYDLPIPASFNEMPGSNFSSLPCTLTATNSSPVSIGRKTPIQYSSSSDGAEVNFTLPSVTSKTCDVRHGGMKEPLGVYSTSILQSCKQKCDSDIYGKTMQVVDNFHLQKVDVKSPSSYDTHKNHNLNVSPCRKITPNAYENVSCNVFCSNLPSGKDTQYDNGTTVNVLPLESATKEQNMASSLMPSNNTSEAFPVSDACPREFLSHIRSEHIDRPIKKRKSRFRSASKQGRCSSTPSVKQWQHNDQQHDGEPVLDVRQFLATWDEGSEDMAASPKLTDDVFNENSAALFVLDCQPPETEINNLQNQPTSNKNPLCHQSCESNIATPETAVRAEQSSPQVTNTSEKGNKTLIELKETSKYSDSNVKQVVNVDSTDSISAATDVPHQVLQPLPTNNNLNVCDSGVTSCIGSTTYGEPEKDKRKETATCSLMFESKQQFNKPHSPSRLDDMGTSQMPEDVLTLQQQTHNSNSNECFELPFCEEADQIDNGSILTGTEVQLEHGHANRISENFSCQKLNTVVKKNICVKEESHSNDTTSLPIPDKQEESLKIVPNMPSISNIPLSRIQPLSSLESVGNMSETFHMKEENTCPDDDIFLTAHVNSTSLCGVINVNKPKPVDHFLETPFSQVIASESDMFNNRRNHLEETLICEKHNKTNILNDRLKSHSTLDTTTMGNLRTHESFKDFSQRDVNAHSKTDCHLSQENSNSECNIAVKQEEISNDTEELEKAHHCEVHKSSSSLGNGSINRVSHLMLNSDETANEFKNNVLNDECSSNQLVNLHQPVRKKYDSRCTTPDTISYVSTPSSVDTQCYKQMNDACDAENISSDNECDTEPKFINNGLQEWERNFYVGHNEHELLVGSSCSVQPKVPEGIFETLVDGNQQLGVHPSFEEKCQNSISENVHNVNTYQRSETSASLENSHNLKCNKSVSSISQAQNDIKHSRNVSITTSCKMIKNVTPSNSLHKQFLCHSELKDNVFEEIKDASDSDSVKIFNLEDESTIDYKDSEKRMSKPVEDQLLREENHSLDKTNTKQDIPHPVQLKDLDQESVTTFHQPPSSETDNVMGKVSNCHSVLHCIEKKNFNGNQLHSQNQDDLISKSYALNGASDKISHKEVLKIPGNAGKHLVKSSKKHNFSKMLYKQVNDNVDVNKEINDKVSACTEAPSSTEKTKTVQVISSGYGNPSVAPSNTLELSQKSGEGTSKFDYECLPQYADNSCLVVQESPSSASVPNSKKMLESTENVFPSYVSDAKDTANALKNNILPSSYNLKISNDKLVGSNNSYDKMEDAIIQNQNTFVQSGLTSLDNVKELHSIKNNKDELDETSYKLSHFLNGGNASPVLRKMVSEDDIPAEQDQETNFFDAVEPPFPNATLDLTRSKLSPYVENEDIYLNVFKKKSTTASSLESMDAMEMKSSTNVQMNISSNNDLFSVMNHGLLSNVSNKNKEKTDFVLQCQRVKTQRQNNNTQCEINNCSESELPSNNLTETVTDKGHSKQNEILPGNPKLCCVSEEPSINPKCDNFCSQEPVADLDIPRTCTLESEIVGCDCASDVKKGCTDHEPGECSKSDEYMQEGNRNLDPRKIQGPSETFYPSMNSDLELDIKNLEAPSVPSSTIPELDLPCNGNSHPLNSAVMELPSSEIVIAVSEEGLDVLSAYDEMPQLEINSEIVPNDAESLEMPCLEAISEQMSIITEVNIPNNSEMILPIPCVPPVEAKTEHISLHTDTEPILTTEIGELAATNRIKLKGDTYVNSENRNEIRDEVASLTSGINNSLNKHDMPLKKNVNIEEIDKINDSALGKEGSLVTGSNQYDILNDFHISNSSIEIPLPINVPSSSANSVDEVEILPAESVLNWPYLEEEVISDIPVIETLTENSPLVNSEFEGANIFDHNQKEEAITFSFQNKLSTEGCEKDRMVSTSLSRLSSIKDVNEKCVLGSEGLKCRLSWKKIFALSKRNEHKKVKGNDKKQRKEAGRRWPFYGRVSCKSRIQRKHWSSEHDLRKDVIDGLELGPAKIEVRLAPKPFSKDVAKSWQVVDVPNYEKKGKLTCRRESNNNYMVTRETLSSKDNETAPVPIVVVKRLILKRRLEDSITSPDKHLEAERRNSIEDSSISTDSITHSAEGKSSDLDVDDADAEKINSYASVCSDSESSTLLFEPEIVFGEPAEVVKSTLVSHYEETNDLVTALEYLKTDNSTAQKLTMMATSKAESFQSQKSSGDSSENLEQFSEETGYDEKTNFCNIECPTNLKMQSFTPLCASNDSLDGSSQDSCVQSRKKQQLPRVIIKRTPHSATQYRSFLRVSETDVNNWQPVVYLQRNTFLDTLARNLSQNGSATLYSVSITDRENLDHNLNLPQKNIPSNLSETAPNDHNGSSKQKLESEVQSASKSSEDNNDSKKVYKYVVIDKCTNDTKLTFQIDKRKEESGRLGMVVRKCSKDRKADKEIRGNRKNLSSNMLFKHEREHCQSQHSQKPYTKDTYMEHIKLGSTDKQRNNVTIEIKNESQGMESKMQVYQNKSVEHLNSSTEDISSVDHTQKSDGNMQKKSKDNRSFVKESKRGMECTSVVQFSSSVDNSPLTHFAMSTMRKRHSLELSTEKAIDTRKEEVDSHSTNKKKCYSTESVNLEKVTDGVTGRTSLQVEKKSVSKHCTSTIPQTASNIRDGETADSSCRACGWVFQDKADRATHIRQHPYHCQRCHLAFRSEVDFVCHLSSEHPSTKEQHHCLLCERSFPTTAKHQLHLSGRLHRHLEATQRRTIHTIFTILTGHNCPGIAPLTESETAGLKWFPAEPGAVHFYHQATPLQMAVQDWMRRQQEANIAGSRSSSDETEVGVPP